MTIPTIDARALSNGTPVERAAFAKELLTGLTNYGFVKLINHSVPVEEVQAVFDAVTKFFRLPFDVKKDIRNDPGQSQQRGWSVVGEEKTWWLESNKGDVIAPEFSDNKESFDCGDPADKQYPNKWPAEKELPGYQHLMESFFRDCGELCVQLLQELATAMQLDPALFASRCTNEASTIRINHFPPIERSKLDTGKISRIWPHNDFGIISLVFPDKTPGLEYEDRENPGNFIPVPYGSKDEVVVIASETLQRWTNGGMRAGLHQVTKPKGLASDVVPERWSLVYFCKADRHVDVGPLPEFIAQDQKPLYKHLSALEYQDMRNAAHYPRLAVPVATEQIAQDA